MSIKLATHLYRNRHGMFYFRFVTPKDLRDFLHKSELRFSLKTEQRHDAIYFAAQIIDDLPRLAADLRRMKKDDEVPPPDYFEKWRIQMFVDVRWGTIGCVSKPFIHNIWNRRDIESYIR